ncbi:hypothetical protein AB1E18_018884 [Capra hircus]
MEELQARELRAVGERDDSRKAALPSAASKAVIHGAGRLCITEANWASVIGSLLSRKRLLQKGLQPPGEACSEPLRWLEAGGRRGGGRRGGGLESCRPERPVTGRIHQSCMQRQIWRWAREGINKMVTLRAHKERHDRGERGAGLTSACAVPAELPGSPQGAGIPYLSLRSPCGLCS